LNCSFIRSSHPFLTLVCACSAKQVPEEAAAAPVPTRGQLSDQFADVARLSRELSLLPEGQGGMLSVAVAKLAAKLKVGAGACWWVPGC
jgi:hypothetical protein